MNEEEKKAVENVKELKTLFEIDDNKDFEATPLVQKEIAKDLKILLNLIKKLRKENEELNYKLHSKKIALEIYNRYIPKSKVKDKIEKLNDESHAEELEDIINRKNYTITELVQYVLQELLEERK